MYRLTNLWDALEPEAKICIGFCALVVLYILAQILRWVLFL